MTETQKSLQRTTAVKGQTIKSIRIDVVPCHYYCFDTQANVIHVFKL